MIGSLWTGISGLSTQQAALDNESHNIANVNTIGYKSSRISFADQMYQDAIGKGAKVVAAEKIFSQGNMKTTGVAYDVALEGSGFFAVKDPNATGSSEEFYTRAGNFRMGESGTLQDANQYDVQGWTISPITAEDITSTNPNVDRFTNDYTKIAANEIIRKDGIIETITTKLTDYTQSAESDSTVVMTGLGMKTMSTKITDVEEIITKYNEKLATYSKNPDANSSPARAQVSYVSLPGGASSSIGVESDQVYIYIDGKKYSQNYIDTTALVDYDPDIGGIDAIDHKIASRVATYQALADQISAIPGLRAYIADAETFNSTTTTYTEQEGALSDIVGHNTDTITNSTVAENIYENPNIVIESIIPGEEFEITEVAEYIASTKVMTPGSYGNFADADAGSGYGAVESLRNALTEAVAGKQRDVWSATDLPTLGNTGGADAIKFTVVDPDDSSKSYRVSMEENDGTGTITYDTLVNGVVVAASTSTGVYGAPTALTDDNKMDALKYMINNHPDMSLILDAKIFNGNLVVQTDTDGVSYTSKLEHTSDSTVGVPVWTAYNKNGDYSVNSGADAELLRVLTTLNQTSSRTELQLRLDNLNISDSAFGDFSVDATGLITMKQDGADFAVGQMAIAMFNNERGLTSEGNNLYGKTVESGSAVYNVNNDKAAAVASKTLELSTADLSESLVNLMVFQRAFEANSKSITTSDQILTTLIQLKK